MNRIDDCFLHKEKEVLSIYFTAGFPALNDTLRIIKSLDKHGADMIEIGIPFSDPVADGPLIQESSKKALGNGMSVNLLFEQLSKLREITDLPVILMGYLNPVFKMGMDTFLEKCQNAGIDGLILPDFPPEEFERNYKNSFEESGVHNIMLITPQTSADRIHYIDKLSSGFIYMVSSYATTGMKGQFTEEQIAYFKRIDSMNLINPVLTGFGISDRISFRKACEYSRGAIIGSAFINAIGQDGFMDDKVRQFLASIHWNS